MTPRLVFLAVVLLSQAGCVAAIPLAAQLVTGANSTTQLCAMTKLPGQTTSLCDRMASTVTTQMSAKTPAGGTVAR